MGGASSLPGSRTRRITCYGPWPYFSLLLGMDLRVRDCSLQALCCHSGGTQGPYAQARTWQASSRVSLREYIPRNDAHRLCTFEIHGCFHVGNVCHVGRELRANGIVWILRRCRQRVHHTYTDCALCHFYHKPLDACSYPWDDGPDKILPRVLWDGDLLLPVLLQRASPPLRYCSDGWCCRPSELHLDGTASVRNVGLKSSNPRWLLPSLWTCLMTYLG